MAERAATITPIRTVKAIVVEFLQRHTGEKSGKRWATETRRVLNRDVLPAIGDKAAAGVGKADIHEILDAIIDRGAPIAANRTLAVLKKFFRWSLEAGGISTATHAAAFPSPVTKRSAIVFLTPPSLQISGAPRRAWPIHSARPSGY